MKILYLPIDITVPEINVSEITSTISREGRYQPFWKTVDITDLRLANLQIIIDQLPFEKVTNIYFKEQTKPALPHYDVYPDMKFEDGEYKHILDNEPIGYRVVLIGNKDKVFIKSKETFKPAIVPNIPGCYLLNSTESLHMVKDDPGRKIIYFRGFVNKEKHRALIERSLEKYKHLAIIE